MEAASQVASTLVGAFLRMTVGGAPELSRSDPLSADSVFVAVVTILLPVLGLKILKVLMQNPKAMPHAPPQKVPLPTSNQTYAETIPKSAAKFASQHNVYPTGEVCVAVHNVNRQAMLALAQPVDHLGSVMMLPDKNFDLNKTIFQLLDKPHLRALMKVKVGKKLFWDEVRVREVQELCERRIAAAKAGPIKPIASTLGPILDFMENQCDFACEHADGSFMDHLNFCRDFSALYMRDCSPRILFLHSIMGVGTNVWPMTKEKIPTLEQLITKEELVHVSAFPTMLRLIKGTDFLDDLYTRCMRGDAPNGITFQRLLDGEQIQLTGDQLFTHLNLHLIHSLDFLQPAGWNVNQNDFFLEEFASYYTLLSHCGKLEAGIELPPQYSLKPVPKPGAAAKPGELLKVNGSFEYDPSVSDRTCADPLTGLPRGGLSALVRMLPGSLTMKLQRRQIRKWTADIGRTLDYAWL